MKKSSIQYGFNSKRDELFPSIVQISVTNVCDMSCSMCPHSDYIRDSDFNKEYLDTALFKRISDEVGENHGTIRLLGWGEALLHPNIVEMVAYAKNVGVEFVNLITNGLGLTHRINEGLLKSNLDILEVSLDAFYEKTYKVIRNNTHFNRIKNNIFDFIKTRNGFNSKTYIAVSIINQPKVKDEIDYFKKYWLQKADNVVLRRYRDFKGHVKGYILPQKKREPCRCLWARFNITPKGKVTVCYDDWQNRQIIGDLNNPKETISNIWQNDHFKKYRKAHLKGSAFGLCKDCKDWIASSWIQPYEVLLEKVRCWQEGRY